ncbi:multifunctional oxoglutarate decarboxylase/oxoglutarate dehydrogenase thiamine pyrophosphate-binding subunit/dihydrolipoyllysine-residue succinyltransferase subunit [Propionibacteriaceae bacterium Y2014]
MATEPSASGTPTAVDFGPNDWLIEEKYDQFRADASSVGEEWRAYFEANPPGATEGAAPSPNEARSAKPASASSATAPEAAATAAKQQSTDPAQQKVKSVSKPAGKSEQAANSEKPVNSDKAGSSAKAGTSTKAASGRSRRATVETPHEVKETRPAKPGSGGGLPADPPNPADRPEAGRQEPVNEKMRGASARTAKNMDLSLSLPVATSVRSLPVKLIIDQRVVINNHLRRARGGKVSYTHLIGYAMVKALAEVPDMNNAYAEIDGKPHLVVPADINLGIAIDMPKPDGTRQLLVPNIKGCQDLDFAQFWAAYEDVVQRARANKLTLDDFAGTTISLTNPGTLGTNHSVPRLMNGQGCIIGVGSMDYPPEFQGSDPERLSDMSVSKVMTLTSTYDHRVIQGAVSGVYLATLHKLLLGENGFYDEIFEALRIPYEPIRWATDTSDHHEDQIGKQARVMELINAYRVSGHLMADTDPLEYRQRSSHDLDVQTHGLTLWDLDRTFATGSFAKGERLPLRKILGILRDSYCRTTGIEYMHILDHKQREWIQHRVERTHESLPREEHLRILDKLNEAEIFETFLQTKFVGQKRFSLEGGESGIALLDEICEQAANAGLIEVCIGMPHRGRLNVLANVVGKSYGQIFKEFEGNIDPRSVQGSGDVKYHLGSEGQFTALTGNTIKTSVAANPSHLEAVNPVLEGITRAKQDILDRGGEFPVLPVLMHGDAAFAGQGVVAETLNLSQLRGYRTGGTIHLVINNQVGFTTSPTESRSSMYCTDVARMVQAPIFHVNGDDPEACIRVARLAFEFRQAFNKDVVIDLVCYRRRGHNEGDDPSFTQPLMYSLIEKKRSVRKLYTEALIGRGDISVEDAEEVWQRFQKRLEDVFEEVRQNKGPEDEEYARVPAYPTKEGVEHGTSIPLETMKKVADAYTNVPDGFTVHPKVLPQLQRRAAAITQGPIDWATAEMLAIGSLLEEGRPVRLTGQDTRRGTFVQRFAAVVDRRTGDSWVPLKHIDDDQGKFHVFDSLLSEYAAVGFEYGYSVARPDALVLWEAQFGDFVNGAQIITDEFITSGQAKWTQKSGVVLLLPHAYEGQGPDHSSARLERWLQLAAEEAIRVAFPSSPANYFHLLREQALREDHRPLIVLTPKSMLRNKLATSQPDDFTSGRWSPVLDDPSVADPSKVEKVILCSGKVRWDLVRQRERNELTGRIAVIAVEGLYPLPGQRIAEALAPYEHLDTVTWVQEEPANQGALAYMSLHLQKALADRAPGHPWQLRHVSRPASAAPSVGSAKIHEREQHDLIDRALELNG